MELTDIGEELKLEDLVEVEKKLSINIPQEYKTFLLKNNGGYVEEFLCTPDFIEIDPETNKSYSQSTNPDKFYDLEEVCEEYDENIDDPVFPEKYLSIAYDSSGNSILLCADGSENNGSIYFANHELYHSENGFYNITKIADSFDEFINMLQPFEESE